MVDLRYVCGTFPFKPDLLTAGAGTAELEATPLAEALRTHLAMPGPDIDFLPDSGWHLVGMDLQNAELLTVAGELGMITVGLSNTGNGWKVTGWGDCQPRVVLPPGLASAEWAFDPDKRLPDADDRTFDALVTEMACNSGEPADGRIVGPQLVKSADTILVIFAVRPARGLTTARAIRRHASSSTWASRSDRDDSSMAADCRRATRPSRGSSLPARPGTRAWPAP